MEKNTKQLIHEKAIALFKQNGYSNTTMNDICKECNITKRTFYYHYESKAEILRSITHDLGKQAKQKLIDHLTDTDAIDKVWIIMSEYCVGGEKYGPDIIKQVYLLSLENNHHDHFPIDTDMYATVTQLIQQAIDLKQLTTSAKANELADILYHTFRSITITWAFEDGSFSLQHEYLKSFNTIFQKK